MENSTSWKVNSFTGSQKISRIIWNQKILYSFHKCPPRVHILSQINPDCTFLTNVLKVHFNIIFPSTLSSCELSLSCRIYHQSLACIVSLPIPAKYPAHLILFDLINEITAIFWAVQITKLLIVHLLPLSCYFLLGPNTLLCILFSGNLSLGPCAFFNARDQVSHPYKTTGRIIVLFTLNLKFLIANAETKDSGRNGRIHFRNSVCCLVFHASNFYLLFFPDIWTYRYFQRICYLFLCYDFFQHPVQETWTHA